MQKTYLTDPSVQSGFLRLSIRYDSKRIFRSFRCIQSYIDMNSIKIYWNHLLQILTIREKLMMNKRILFLFLFIFRLAFVEKTRESDDEKKRRQGGREGEREMQKKELS